MQKINTLNLDNKHKQKPITRQSKEFLIEEALVALLVHGEYDWCVKVVEFLHCKDASKRYGYTLLERANNSGYQNVLDLELKGGKTIKQSSIEELNVHMAYTNQKKFSYYYFDHDISRLEKIKDMIDCGDISDLCQWSQSWIKNNTKGDA